MPRMMVCAAAVATAVLCVPPIAAAQGPNFTVPAGDALAQTPPIDITPQQLRAAPPQFRTPERIGQIRRAQPAPPSSR